MYDDNSVLPKCTLRKDNKTLKILANNNKNKYIGLNIENRKL